MLRQCITRSAGLHHEYIYAGVPTCEHLDQNLGRVSAVRLPVVAAGTRTAAIHGRTVAGILILGSAEGPCALADGASRAEQGDKICRAARMSACTCIIIHAELCRHCTSQSHVQSDLGTELLQKCSSSLTIWKDALCVGWSAHPQGNAEKWMYTQQPRHSEQCCSCLVSETAPTDTKQWERRS